MPPAQQPKRSPAATPTAQPRGGEPSAGGVDVDRQLDTLDRAIERYRVDAQRFIAGDLKIPPDDLRDRITADVRRLRSRNLTGAAVNFRLGSLEARFHAHLDLFGRRLRAQEEGALARRRDEEAPPDPERGVVIGARPDAVAVNALYQGLYLRDRATPPAMDLERFRSYVDRQVEAIRAKTGCSQIQFRVAEEDGKLKLKARPLREPAS